MPMFSFNKSSYESRILNVLQDKFFITARRNKILAKWAAGRMNYTGAQLSQYVRSVIFAYLIVPNDRKMIEKILADFKSAHINISEEEIKLKIHAIEGRIKNKMRLNHAS
ncbi:MAG: DUF1476 domain-containing protein [Alphaproteobacteria bacterium]|nr:DUF1476 domain-containing protein [Alphaproteobacteria bacterium]